MSSKLILIGYWSETPDVEGDLIHPQYLRDRAVKSPARDRLVDYLKSGFLIFECMGYSFCRLPDGPPKEKMGWGHQTDGVWIWPQGLWIYVEQFGVELPDEFICHLEQCGFARPRGLDKDALHERGSDLSFWKEWCRRKKAERV